MRNIVTVFELSNPWPTRDDAITTARFVAKQAYGVYGDRLDSVWMYGSRARGDHQPDSDLDLLLVKKSKDIDPRNKLEEQLYMSLLDQFSGDMRVMVSLHTADVEQLEQWDTMFYRSVRADAIRVA